MMMRMSGLVVIAGVTMSCAGPAEVPDHQEVPASVDGDSSEETSLKQVSEETSAEALGELDGETGGQQQVEVPEDVERSTLTSVLERAETHATSVLEAKGRKTTAEGERKSETMEFAPTIRAGMGARYINGRAIGTFGDVQDGVGFGEFEPSVTAGWQFSPFEQVSEFRAAERRDEAAGLMVADQKRRAMNEASRLYFQVLLARSSVQIATDLVNDAETFVALAKARTSAGVDSGSDVARAEAELAKAKQKRERAVRQWKVMSARLAEILGWETGQPIAPPEGELLQTKTMVNPDAADQWLSMAKERRMDLEALESQLEAAEQETRAARWSIFGVEAAGSLGGRLYGVELGSLGPTFLGNGFVGLRLDLTQVGEVKAMRGEVQVEEAERTRKQRMIRRQVSEVKARLTAAANSIEEARKQVEAAERDYDIQRSRFEAGTGLGLDVIRAQNSVANARMDLAEQIASYNVAQTELLAVLGVLSPSAVDGPTDGADAGGGS